MTAAGWFPADPIPCASSLRIAVDSGLRRPDDDAPVSNLYLFGRQQDLAFEQPVGGSPGGTAPWSGRALEQTGDSHRPAWVGSATFDERVGLSYTTGQVTHHIGPDVDQERDRITTDAKGRMGAGRPLCRRVPRTTLRQKWRRRPLAHRWTVGSGGSANWRRGVRRFGDGDAETLSGACAAWALAKQAWNLVQREFGGSDGPRERLRREVSSHKSVPEIVMFVRHGEKPAHGSPPHGVNHHGEPDEHSLSVRGSTRAGALAGLFAHGPAKSHPHIVQPGRVFATRPTHEAKSKREKYTADAGGRAPEGSRDGLLRTRR